MGAGALHKRNAARDSPDQQPISRIADVAFATAGPAAAKRMHSMMTLEFGNRFRGILDNEVDNLCKRCIIDVLFIESFEVAAKCW